MKSMPLPLQQQPLVTIVTPSFNQDCFLGQCIDSVLNQNYARIEHIVMDGGSNDRSIEILSRVHALAPKFFRWFSQPDEGQGMAVNKGWQLAQGQIIGWLNSDDLLCPDAIACVVEYFETHPDHLMVYGEADWIDASGQFLGHYPTRPPNEVELLRSECFLCQPAVFFRSELIHEIGWLDKNLVTAMDYDYWIRAFKSLPGRIGYIQKRLALSRLHDKCKTLLLRKKVFIESMGVIHRNYSVVPESWFFSCIHELLNPFNKEQRQLCTRKDFFDIIKSTFIFFSKHTRSSIKDKIRKDQRFIVNSDFLKIDITSDGWTTNSCKVLVNNIAGAYDIILTILHERPHEGPVDFLVTSDRQDIVKYCIPRNGVYTIRIPLPLIPGKQDAFNLYLICNNMFVPSEVDPLSTDCRSLGVRVLNALLK